MTRSKEEAHKLSTVINERFHVNAVPNSYVIDIGKGNITKSTAIHHVIEAFESFDDVYTIGDELNDKEMLRDFNGYTMNHGLDELKEITLGSYNEVSELIYDLLKEEF
jgi:hydroxymethylpyrimidine pyrophosphatase-like HAD family hydrolase